MHQLDLRRQQVVDAVADDGVGLAAAYFHDDPRPGDGAVYFTDGRTHQLGVAVFGDVLHV